MTASNSNTACNNCSCDEVGSTVQIEILIKVLKTLCA